MSTAIPQKEQEAPLTLHYPLGNRPMEDTPGDALERIATMLEHISAPLLAYIEHIHSTHPVKPPRAMSDADVHRLEASPIGPFLMDDTISDILVNGPSEIYIERDGILEKTSVQFPDERSLRALAENIAHSVGRAIDPKRPLADARLKDGSRVNIIAAPMAINGLTLSIRKFPKREITLDTLVETGSITPQLAAFLALCGRSRTSILISGGTGTGKTTMLNAISHYIPNNERIITIEDTAELRLQQPHVVRLETKEPSVIGERHEEVNTSDLVRNALRMRPDRIIVGEVRGVEVYDMVQAMNTGHEGSMTTVHANAPREALMRLENLLSPVIQNTPAASIRRQLVSALNIIIQLGYGKDGKRFVTSVTDVVGLEGDIPTMQEIFTLKEEVDATGNVSRTQVWTGILPHHAKLAEMIRAENIFPPPPK